MFLVGQLIPASSKSGEQPARDTRDHKWDSSVHTGIGLLLIIKKTIAFIFPRLLSELLQKRSTLGGLWKLFSRRMCSSPCTTPDYPCSFLPVASVFSSLFLLIPLLGWAFNVTKRMVVMAVGSSLVPGDQKKKTTRCRIFFSTFPEGLS